MDILSGIIAADVVSMVFFTLLGVGMMYVVWKLIDWFTPFPIMKEIEADQNIALAILVGMLFVAISIIIAAVIVS